MNTSRTSFSIVRKDMPVALLVLIVVAETVLLGLAAYSLWLGQWLSAGFYLVTFVVQAWIVMAVSRRTPPSAVEKAGVLGLAIAVCLMGAVIFITRVIL